MKKAEDEKEKMSIDLFPLREAIPGRADIQARGFTMTPNQNVQTASEKKGTVGAIIRNIQFYSSARFASFLKDRLIFNYLATKQGNRMTNPTLPDLNEKLELYFYSAYKAIAITEQTLTSTTRLE